jgi:hypothetical protein
MKKFIFYIFIIVFLTKTGNVFSKNNIFSVDNIIIKNEKNEKREELVNKAIKKGFKELINKILLSKDLEIVKNTNLINIKKLISSYQIIENNEGTDKDEVLINLIFDRNKINNFFFSQSISYADVSKAKVLLYPVLIKNDNFYVFSNNYYYNNWNTKEHNNKDFIEYVLPVENLEDIQFINKNRNNLESADIKTILSDYELRNYIFLVINNKDNQIDVFLRGFVDNNHVSKNIKIDSIIGEEEKNLENSIQKIKQEINEIWKSYNLIDVRTPSFLNIYLDIKKANDLLKLKAAFKKIELIENFNVLELNKSYAKISIKYLGKVSKIKSEMLKQGIILNITNNEWKLNII